MFKQTREKMAQNMKPLANILNIIGIRLIIRALAVYLFLYLKVCELS